MLRAVEQGHHDIDAAIVEPREPVLERAAVGHGPARVTGSRAGPDGRDADDHGRSDGCGGDCEAACQRRDLLAPPVAPARVVLPRHPRLASAGAVPRHRHRVVADAGGAAGGFRIVEGIEAHAVDGIALEQARQQVHDIDGRVGMAEVEPEVVAEAVTLHRGAVAIGLEGPGQPVCRTLDGAAALQPVPGEDVAWIGGRRAEVPDRAERDQGMHLDASGAGPGQQVAQRIESAVDGDPLGCGLAAIEVEGVAASPHLHVQDVGTRCAGARNDGADVVRTANAAVERVDEGCAPLGRAVLAVRWRSPRAHQPQDREDAADPLEAAVGSVRRKGCLHTHADAMVRGHLSGCPRCGMARAPAGAH